jgi:mgtE-like transporter
VTTFRRGLDPDNFGIPLITSSMDFVGVIALIIAMVTFGVA